MRGTTKFKVIMSEIKHEELFGNLKNFLKSKGIELQEGSYTQRVRKGCEIMASTINLSQRTFKRAKSAVETGLDQLRQTIHEQSAPKSSEAGRAGDKKGPGKAAREAGRSSRSQRKSSKPVDASRVLPWQKQKTRPCARGAKSQWR